MPVSEPLARPLRVFVAGISHETNSFSPLPTSMRSFETDCAYVPPALAMRDIALAFPGYGDAIRTVTGKGDHPVEGPCFFAQPSAPCSASVFARLRDAILDALRDAGPIDIVLLALHGAMVAEGVGDCEGDLLMAVRALVGPEMPVGVILDLHGNVGARMIDSGAMLVGVKEYPHSDYALRVNELYAMLVDMARIYDESAQRAGPEPAGHDGRAYAQLRSAFDDYGRKGRHSVGDDDAWFSMGRLSRRRSQRPHSFPECRDRCGGSAGRRSGGPLY